MLATIVLVCASVDVRAQPAGPTTPAAAHLYVIEAHGLAAALDAAGLPPTLAPSRAMFELIRVLHRAPAESDAISGNLQRQVTAALAAVTPARDAPRTPSPLPVRTWRELLGGDIDDDGVFAAILASRSASLLYYGLSALDDETLTYLLRERTVLRALLERAPSSFAAFAPALRVRGGVVDWPGGPDAKALWTQLLPAGTPTATERLIPLIFEHDAGRFAYLMFVGRELDPARREYLLGGGLTSEVERRQQLRAIYDAVLHSERAWQPDLRPWGRVGLDLQQIFTAVTFDADGAPARPAWQWLWTAVADGRHTRPTTAGGSPPVSAESIARLIELDRSVRRERFEAFLFAQRVFTTISEADAVPLVEVLRSFGRYRALFLNLERMGVRDPRLYGLIQRRAAALGSPDEGEAFIDTVLLQGGLVFIERARFWRAFDPERAESLVRTLAEASAAEGERFSDAFLRWLVHDFIGREDARTAPDGSGVEDDLLDLLAGTNRARRPTRVTYEGLDYLVDPPDAERARLTRMRERQEDERLDDVIEMFATIATLRQGKASPAQTTSLGRSLDRIRRPLVTGERLSPHAEALRRESVDAGRSLREASAGVPAAPTAARNVDALRRLADRNLADVILAIVYATALGDPDGAVIVGGDVWRRHEFGVTGVEAESRNLGPWTLPVESVGAGRTWRVLGSLLGLDLALGRLSLRRLDGEYPPRAPSVSGFDRVALTQSAALFSPVDQTDADRDRLADAIGRGQARIAALGRNGGAVAQLIDDLQWDGLQARTLRWSLLHAPDTVPALFSLTDAYWLGAGTELRPDGWGTTALPVSGCLCTRFPVPATLSTVVGRPGTGLLATRFADLPLLAVLTLHRMQLPAPLARGLVVLLTQTVLDLARPAHADDLASLSGFVRDLPAVQLEDYIAALTYDGALRPVKVTGAGEAGP